MTDMVQEKQNNTKNNTKLDNKMGVWISSF